MNNKKITKGIISRIEIYVLTFINNNGVIIKIAGIAPNVAPPDYT